MKLTLNIDDKLLTRVMKSTGAKTKTDAIHAALAEVDRRHKLIALLSEDIGIDFDKDIDVNSWAENDRLSSKVAEDTTSGSAKIAARAPRKSVRYASKPGPR